MNAEDKGIGIIFHSGALDRFHHGMSIALAALARGQKVKLFFTYWALEYLKREPSPLSSKGRPDNEIDSHHNRIIQENIEKGHLESFSELISQSKMLGAELYTCTNSMSILNIARDELNDLVDRPMGLTTFLSKVAADQILFI